MTRPLAIAALSAAALLLSAPRALAQAHPAAGRTGTDARSDVVAGEVVRIDAAQSRVTVRAADGETFEFTASPETLKGLKPGDHIEAKKRAPGK